MTNKYPKSKLIQYSALILLVYLLARAITGDYVSLGMSVGLTVGMVFGSKYEMYKLLEAQSIIQKESVPQTPPQ